MRGRYSLRNRLTLSLLAVFVFGACATGAFLFFEVQLRRTELFKRTLHGQARDLEAGLVFSGCSNPQLSLGEDWTAAYGQPGSRFAYAVFDASRKPVLWSPRDADPFAFVEIPDGENYSAMQFEGVEQSRSASVAKRADCGYTILAVRKQPDPEMVAESILLEESTEHFLALIPFVFISLWLIWLVSGISLRPVERASREAAAIGPADLDRRISLKDLPVEIEPLVEAVNSALGRLARAYTAEREFTVNAAHELRTPLSLLNLRLQRARAGAAVNWDELERDSRRIGDLIGQLLDLARKENALSADADTQEVNLSRILREAAAQLLPLAEQSGRRIEVEAPSTIMVIGAPDDLHDMFVNLLSNALIHGMGTVAASLRQGDSEDGRGCAVVEVSDEGDGIPGEYCERVFSRFFKVSDSTPGSGLGLAIVHQIVQNHRGWITFQPGPGGVVRVSLPLRGSPGNSKFPART